MNIELKELPKLMILKYEFIGRLLIKIVRAYLAFPILDELSIDPLLSKIKINSPFTDSKSTYGLFSSFAYLKAYSKSCK